jgi:Protein of unknown function (DUF3060)
MKHMRPNAMMLALAGFCCAAIASAADAQQNSPLGGVGGIGGVVGGTLSPVPAANAAAFQKSAETATLDCAGGKAEVKGSSNELTITGKCSSLDIIGSANEVKIEFGPDAQINVSGSANDVEWTSTDGRAPKVNDQGSANSVTPQQKFRSERGAQSAPFHLPPRFLALVVGFVSPAAHFGACRLHPACPQRMVPLPRAETIR